MGCLTDNTLVPQTDTPSLIHTIILSSISLDKSPRFSLALSGVLASLLGGDEALSGMATVHVYGDRRWLGWYNTPGSFQIFEQLRSFMKSVSQTHSLSQNVNTDPATLFNLDAYNGPKFRAAHSGTTIEETGYLATLFTQECAAWESEGRVVPGRRTNPVGITIADLGQAPTPGMRAARTSASTVFFAGIPISVSVATCVLCAAYEDWYGSLSILMGTVANGVFCSILGSADFVFTHSVPAKGSPAGDGILGSDKDIVLLRGEESTVNAITRGRYCLRFSSRSHYNLMRWCSFLFLVQSIMQPLLIPQASLFGQTMFLISLGVSALYNAWLSSMDNEKVHRKFLFEQVFENPRLRKYTLGTRTSAGVFALLVLQPQDPTGLMNQLFPNDTKVWRQWKETILERLRQQNDQSFHLGGNVGYLEGFTQEEKDLLAVLYEDAKAAYNGYRDYLQADSP